MEKQLKLDEVLAIMDDTARKNYALTELLAQTFSAFVVSTGNKDAIAEFVKSTSSVGELSAAHKHAQTALLKILNSVEVIPTDKH
ncbi:Uncharacterised protein [Yersinia enterocolitica]|uniref:hypothetical protein n=1 Tax=Yersinia enterocolitica TaxID=630 RepID=UPI0005E9DA40|nr:hypothetical protein [Yersinia enterocolitica]CNG64478.1 Uncharacterised protein [Yersinia enterocolitica]